ncbi:ABC transporter permease [Halomonas elongata]|uniref:Ribose transport system permease protein RbsC n=1 Tax=Halomonas elongata TaxID=2746 RepID=A0A1B8NXN7_HALEL|nr:ABC transporter permease [Halomonas elongata]MBW5801959.1 ABC transporter permease [Halomonas elongata]OBX34791.1 ribose transport system permease protein RbsC [Halomonas elongata]WVI71220.1 ABC transporter permease [Halomonas elongata]
MTTATDLSTHDLSHHSKSFQASWVLLQILKLRIFVALFAVLLYFSLTVDNFLTMNNMLIMAQHITVIGILSIGMTLVILTAGIDLSVGSTVGFSGMVSGFLLMNGIPLGDYTLFLSVPEVILLTCLVGAFIGYINGALITYLNVAPFIATLGMLYVVRGAALLFNDGGTFSQLQGHEELGNTGFSFLGNGSLLGIGIPVWLLLILTLVTWFVSYKTPFGRYVYAIGGNENAAIFSGLRVRKIKLWVYIFSGFCAAIVGLVITSQLQTGHPMTGDTYELRAIAAVVLGGTALAGGRGSVIGSVIGACVISILNDGMVMSGVSDFWQMVIMGLVIIIAVVIDQLQQRLQKRVMVTT